VAYHYLTKNLSLAIASHLIVAIGVFASSAHAQESTTPAPTRGISVQLRGGNAAQAASDAFAETQLPVRRRGPRQDGDPTSDGNLSPRDGGDAPQSGYDGDLTNDGRIGAPNTTSGISNRAIDAARNASPDARERAPSDGDLTREGQLDDRTGAQTTEPLQAGSPQLDRTENFIDRNPDELPERDPLEEVSSDEAALSAPPSSAALANLRLRTDPSLRSDDAYEQNPYDPIGVRIGNFIVLPELTSTFAFTDNVFQSSQLKKSDVAVQFVPSVVVASDWSAHELELSIAGLLSYYREFSSENDREFQGRARGRLDFTSRTSLTGEASYSLTQESRSDPELPTGTADRPNVRTSGAAAAVDHRFNRLSLRLRGNLERTSFSDAVLLNGVVDPQDDRDFTDRAAQLRGAYQFNSDVTAFVQGEVLRRSYKRPARSDDILRSSKGFEVTAGVEGNLSPTITGTAAVGYVEQNPDDVSLKSIQSVVVNANLTWRPSALTTVRLNAQTDIDGTTLAGASGQLTQIAGIEVEHSFRRYLIAIAGASYEKRDYVGSALEERQLIGALGIEYLFNQNWAIVAGYEHTRFESTEAGRDYHENAFQIGVRARR